MTSYTNMNGVQMLVLPAQHPATLARRGKAPTPPNPETTVQQVYAPGFTHVVNVKLSAVQHMPPASMNVTRLVLCTNYDAAAAETSCKMGSRCKFVHADTSAAAKHEIHVNYAWRTAEAVTYERFAAGQVLEVVAPNGKAIGDVMESQMALKTKALATKRRPLSHCAHYYFNRTCNLGADCQFIHAVFIDPNAKDHARAPVPAQLGRQQQQNPGTGMRARASAPPAVPAPRCKQQQTQPQPQAAGKAANAGGRKQSPGRHATPAPGALALPSPPQRPSRAATPFEACSGCSTPVHAMHESASDSGSHTPHSEPLGASVASTGSTRRVRHDPYSFGGRMVSVGAV